MTPTEESYSGSALSAVAASAWCWGVAFDTRAGKMRLAASGAHPSTAGFVSAGKASRRSTSPGPL